MEPAAYQVWLAGGVEGSLAGQGEKLFQKYACNTCHTDDATGRGPSLAGAYGKQVMLADNTSVLFDDNYTRESILNPTAKIVKGFQPVMPTFQGQVTEEELVKLLAYVKSRAETTTTTPAAGSAPAATGTTAPTGAAVTATSTPAAPPAKAAPAASQNQGR
jgi:cytochrome c oxidase subunit 2